MTSDTIRDLSDLVGPVKQLTAAEIDHARRHAAEHATDAADLRLLLTAMGIGAA